MNKQTVKRTLEESLSQLGLSAPMTESQNDNSVEDPLDGKFVTRELLDRISALNMEDLDLEDIDEIIEELKDKELPEDDEIEEDATNLVHGLMEVKARIIRRAKAGKTAKKRSRMCPPGYRMKDGKCVRAAIAAGGMGKLKKMARLKKKWKRSGKGKMSLKKSKRWSARRESFEQSNFASELSSIMEGYEVATMTERSEVIDRLNSIFGLLSEAFDDESIDQVYESAMDKIEESQNVGKLDESVMTDEEFIAELSPAVTLVRKSFGKIMDGGLGNE